MIININSILKFLITNILLLSSFYLLYNGYIKLNPIILNQSFYLVEDNKVAKKNEKGLIFSSNTDYIKTTSDNISDIKKNIELNQHFLKVKKNDTFSQLIDPYFENKNEKNKVIKLIQTKYDLNYLKIGQNIFLLLNDNNKIAKIIIPINFFSEIIVEKNDENDYFIYETKTNVAEQLISKKFIIENSLYQDGVKKEIPIKILAELIKLYSFDIDFQRDIQKGNELEILYNVFYNENRDSVFYEKIYYVKLKLQKSNLEYFLFQTQEGYYDYFDKEGKNVKKALMKTPIDGARLSSSFGMRKHPILGYNKLHKGLDFAAPTGTPVFAAGNGVIEKRGKNGAYGNYIRIRHNNSYKTAYAHLNSFKKGISVGVRVNQGDIIGYVGSTGRSTGPHLHYEIIYKNKQINPMKMNLPPNKKLKGEELDAFKKESKIIFSNYLFNLYE